MQEQYLTYEEYVNYGGSLSEDAFKIAEFKARKRIDYQTDSRVKAMESVPESVKLCMMSLIKLQGIYGPDALADHPLVASFSTDGYSESYGSAADQLSAAEKSADFNIRQMLYGEFDDTGTPLLYRGLVI